MPPLPVSLVAAAGAGDHDHEPDHDREQDHARADHRQALAGLVGGLLTLLGRQTLRAQAILLFLAAGHRPGRVPD